MPSILSRPEPLSMEKSKTLLGDDAILPHPLMFSLIRILGLIFVDPFRLNMLSGLNFQPVKHDVARLAPYSEVMAHWPRDNQSRLRFRRLEFVDEVFGTESIEFDVEGIRPYAGLADDRIVRWMGEAVGGETFTVVSPNCTHVGKYNINHIRSVPDPFASCDNAVKVREGVC
ncbi:protein STRICTOSIDINE SYNTHASE-LIKE 13-like [Asparagus officinalis]|uniref:protein STRICTOSIDINE SYNTHASE-LIKE 13-like n=1 Tax=Asparagus officinalis TaxID=4686 RepID=UPI00098E4088|nr:protein STRICTOSIDINE SYNTHASE-LIKE 13-like [Asparagus officinalis]